MAQISDKFQRALNDPVGSASRFIRRTGRNLIYYTDRRLIYYTFLSYIRRVSRGRQQAKIMFYPGIPNLKWSAIRKMCAELGFGITQELSSNVVLCVHWHDKTVVELPDQGSLISNGVWINHKCSDISKKAVTTHFETTFGYSLNVDPLAHNGPCVEKSDENATHDGIIVHCPIEHIKPGAVYQKIVNNVCNEMLVEDIRTPIIGDLIPFIYLKYRPLSSRFSNDNSFVQIKRTEEVFSRQETNLILEFSQSFELDYGELDILRDRDDVRLYIVDVSKCPSGPPNHLPSRESKLAIKLLAQAFSKEFIR